MNISEFGTSIAKKFFIIVAVVIIGIVIQSTGVELSEMTVNLLMASAVFLYIGLYLHYLTTLHKRLMDAGVNRSISIVIVIVSFVAPPIGLIALISGFFLPTKESILYT